MSVLRSLQVLVFPLFVVSLSYHENGRSGTAPLKGVVVTGEFFDCLGEVVVRRRTWVTDAPTSRMSNYKFFLDGEAVVSGFNMRIGESKRVGVVKEKNQVQNNSLKHSPPHGPPWHPRLRPACGPPTRPILIPALHPPCRVAYCGPDLLS
jgi:hypothetical protein